MSVKCWGKFDKTAGINNEDCRGYPTGNVDDPDATLVRLIRPTLTFVG